MSDSTWMEQKHKFLQATDALNSNKTGRNEIWIVNSISIRPMPL